MKVKLSYSVDFDQVPNEINRFLDKARDLLSDIQGDLSQSKYMVGAGPGLLQELDAMRKSMLSLDVELENVMSIVIGYSQAINEQQAMAQESQSPTQTPVGEETGE